MRRFSLLLFALCFVTFGWFHQGGGWNQNARFAEVRAIVEQGRFAVDDFLVYRNGEGRMLVRPKVERGEFTHDGVRHQLSWGDWQNVGTAAKPDWQQRTVNDTALDPAATMVIIGEGTCTGDIGIAPDGHFHPNKPPGASLLAVPVYFLLLHAERALGYSPDDWWVLTVNAWLCSALTVGLVSALGVVVFFRLASTMYPGQTGAALAGALMLGFGTTYFPFATLMFDHNLTAVFLLASFAAVRSDRPMLAGTAAGAAAITNYLAAIPGAFFGVWALCRISRGVAFYFTTENTENTEGGLKHKDATPWLKWSRHLNVPAAARFTLGVLPCLVALLAYNHSAFGTAFAVNTSFQNPAFKELQPAFLGMFIAPQWFAAVTLTVSPWRGIFVLCPALLLGVVGLWQWWRAGTFPAERRIILAIAAFFFGVNICFNGFHGGFAAGPRYLIAVMPFLCLPLVGALLRFCKVQRSQTLAIGLIAFSILQNTLLTVTDALCPLGVGAHAWVNHPGEWKDKITRNSLVWHYAWPLFHEGKATPVIEGKWQEFLIREREQKADQTMKDSARDAVERGEPEPLWIAAMPGPVSVNVMGLWDGTYFQNSPAHSDKANWASFNAGELLAPQSRWSLAPLTGLWLLGGLALSRWRRRQLQIEE